MRAVSVAAHLHGRFEKITVFMVSFFRVLFLTVSKDGLYEVIVEYRIREAGYSY